MRLAALLLPLLLLANSAPSAPEWVLRNQSYREFLTDLQSAVRADDRQAVVELIGLPLKVYGPDDQAETYRSASSIERDYEGIFTPSVRDAILQQRFEELFGRDQGVMIGNGEIWFDHVCPNAACAPKGPVRIKTVNR